MIDVRHPHIVELYNAGKNGPYCWAAMELIEGESMTDVIRRIGLERERERASNTRGIRLDENVGVADQESRTLQLVLNHDF